MVICQEPARFGAQVELGLNVDHWLAVVLPLDALALCS